MEDILTLILFLLTLGSVAFLLWAKLDSDRSTRKSLERLMALRGDCDCEGCRSCRYGQGYQRCTRNP